MKTLKIVFAVVLFLVLALLIYYFTYYSFLGVGGEGSPETSPAKDKDIQEYNIEQEKKISDNRFPCDTIALRQYIIDNYEAGTYLVEFDKTFTYNIAREAVIYFNENGKQYIFAVIAKSKKGERLIEKKNLIGFESSFINLDSTKLGTAFFYLTLFSCEDDRFNFIWEAEVPIHGGFNSLKLKRWRPKNMYYVELNYAFGIISGHRNFNYFLIDGIEKPPHLLETYVGIVHKRTIANVNNDKYPDYNEFRFLDDSLSITQIDSIPFYWSEEKQLYITDKNRRWFRKY